ncbi:efflux RND transporter permease subunit, partial [Salmonella sp. SKLX110369]|uniref:efflux RND transporter permease subunit n=1 Tax=Salmonella sp. SKLX110369 TaxID=3160060 RepID=UPI00375523AA
MIEWIIRRSVANRFLVMMGALFLSIWGTWTIINTPVDALPDLSDVQVIIKTSYPGQAPQIVENQVTYPLTTTMLSVPGAKTVRGFSGTVAKLAMRQPFVLFKGLTFQKLCLPGAFRPGDHHNKMLRPG